MKNVKKYFLFIFLTLFTQINLFGQISGISGGKLSVPDGGTLEQGTFEFEPSFSVSRSSRFFDFGGQEISIKGENVSSTLLFRITTGVAENLEVGSVISSTIEQIDLGAKYSFLIKENFKASFTAGGTLPAGNQFIADSFQNESGNYSAAIGVIATNEFSDIVSLDIAFSYRKIFGEYSYHDILSLGAGLGYMFTESWQGVLELNSLGCYEQGMYTGKLAAASGFTYKVTQSLLFGTGLQYDLLGKNDLKNFSYFAAFTISFN